MEGANGTDYCAMKWLSEQEVDRRYFVSDGGISLSGELSDRGISKILKICKDYDIVRVMSMDRLIPVIRGTRRPCRFPLPPTTIISCAGGGTPQGFAYFRKLTGLDWNTMTSAQRQDQGEA
jgi:hypothetical protein